MKKLLTLLALLVPGLSWAGVHVMQNDNVTVSSFTTLGTVAISSGVLLNGTAGTNGQVFTSGGPDTIPSWTTVSGGGGGTAGIVSPGTFTWVNTGFGINVGTATFGNATDTTLGNAPWAIIQTSGTAQALTITGNGNPSGGVQNQSGLLNINATLGSKPQASLVIIDSVTDSQIGAGELEIWSNNPLHNDPIIWIHRTSSNSSPEMRWDSPSPNMEMVNTSTDNAHGLGKWEPYAEASQGVDLQVNNRAWSNGTFETLAYWHPLSKLDLMPGLYLNPQNVTDDGSVITSSDTTGISFFTLNAHTVGLTAPQSATASYMFGLPDTVGASGNILYNNGNRGGNFSVRQWKWTGNDLAYSVANGVTISTLTINTPTLYSQSCLGTSATGKIQAGTCTGGGGGGASTLAVGTGTTAGYTGTIISSPTAIALFDNSYFAVSLQGGSTAFITPLSSTFTMYGANIPASAVTAGSLGSGVIASSITLASMYGAPTLVGTNFTSLPGAQVGSGVPAVNIAAGSLGASVIASSLAVNSVYPAAVSAGSYPNITGVGTVTAGIWNGTALTSTYLPVDTVYNDNASQATFSSSVTVNNTLQATTYTFPNQGNTRVVFMNGANLGTSSTFTWDGTTMSATNVTGSTITASTYLSVTGRFGINSQYGASLGSATVRNLSASLPVQTDANENLTSAAIDLSGTQVTNTLGSTHGGTGISTSPVVEIFVPAGVMAPTVSSGAAAVQVSQSSTNFVNFDEMTFSNSATSYAEFPYNLPPSWDGSTVTFRVVMVATGSLSGSAIFRLQGIAIGDGNPMDSPGYGTPALTTATFVTSGNIIYSTESQALTIGGTTTGGNYLTWRFYRDRSNGSDTMAGNALVLGVKIRYTRKRWSD